MRAWETIKKEEEPRTDAHGAPSWLAALFYFRLLCLFVPQV